MHHIALFLDGCQDCSNQNLGRRNVFLHRTRSTGPMHAAGGVHRRLKGAHGLDVMAAMIVASVIDTM